MADGRFSQKATRQRAKLRIALSGPSGSGKSWTGLIFAMVLAKRYKTRVGAIDTERESLSLYADQELEPGLPAEFYPTNLTDFSPVKYTAAINDAGREGCGVLLIDGLSHAWEGIGGALEMKDKAADISGNSYTAWKDVTPAHRRMVDAILQYPGHVIVTMRSNTETVLVRDTNKAGKEIVVPKKIGMAPIQRKGMEYEFTIFGDMDLNHTLTITKTRCSAIDGLIVTRPDSTYLNPVIQWLETGVVGEQIEGSFFKPTLDQKLVDKLNSLVLKAGMPEDNFTAALHNAGVGRVEDLSEGEAKDFIARLEGIVAKRSLPSTAHTALMDSVKPPQDAKPAAADQKPAKVADKPAEAELDAAPAESFMANIDRPTIDAILKELDEKCLTWPETRKLPWFKKIGGNPDLVSGVDSLSQEQGSRLLSILIGPPSDNVADKPKTGRKPRATKAEMEARKKAEDERAEAAKQSYVPPAATQGEKASFPPPEEPKPAAPSGPPKRSFGKART